MKILPLLIIPLLFLFPAALPGAEERRTSLGPADLEKIFTEIVLQDAPWPKEELALTNFSAQPEMLTIPSPSYEIQVVQPPQAERLGKKVATIAIMVEGREYERVRLSGDLELYGEVVCTTKSLPRHARISAEDITSVRRAINLLDSGPVLNQGDAIGKQLKTSLRPGAVLYEHLLESPPLVQRGDLVTIVAESDKVKITAPGEARDSGGRGEFVKVKNLMSRREIFAKVLASGVVETEF